MPDALATSDDTDPLGAPVDLAPAMDEARQNAGQARQRVQRGAAEKAAMMQDLGGEMKDYRAQAANRPQEPEGKPPPDNQVSMEAAGTWLAAATVFGAIAGALTRRHTMNALAAFTGTLEGLKEGNQTKFEQQSKIWEQQNKQAYQSWKMANDAYQKILDDKKLDMDTKSFMIQQKAIQVRDDTMAEQAALRDYITMAQLQDARAREAQRGLTAFQTLQERIRHNQATEGAALDEKTVDEMADQLRAGDTSVLTNLGRGAQGAQNVVKVRGRAAQKDAEEGVTGVDRAATNAEYGALKSGMRVSGTREANIGMAVNEARNMIPQAIEASRAASRSGTVVWNSVIGRWDVQTGDPAWARHVAATNSLLNVYSRAVSGGTSTVSGREDASHVLNPTMPVSAYEAAVGQMDKEMQSALRAPGQVREQLKQPGPAPGRLSAPQQAQPKPVNGGGGADPLSQARDAIAKGAPREAVIRRLQERGINPAGL